MQKKIIIFDLDGTLLNTIEDLALCMNRALRKNVLPIHNTDSYKLFVGNGVDVLIQRAAFPVVDIEILKEVKNNFILDYTQNLSVHTTLYPGVKSLLLSLQSNKMMIAVASNKPHHETEKVIAHYFPEINFISILGKREGVPAKPNPQIVLDTLRFANVNSSEALYVGDSSVDMQTAVSANVLAVGCTWGFRTRTELIENGANHIIDSPNELLFLL